MVIVENLRAVYVTAFHKEKIMTNKKRYSLNGKNVKAFCRAHSIKYDEYMVSDKYNYDDIQCDSSGYYSFVGAFNKVYRFQRLSTACDFD